MFVIFFPRIHFIKTKYSPRCAGPFAFPDGDIAWSDAFAALRDDLAVCPVLGLDMEWSTTRGYPYQPPNIILSVNSSFVNDIKTENCQLKKIVN